MLNRTANQMRKLTSPTPTNAQQRWGSKTAGPTALELPPNSRTPGPNDGAVCELNVRMAFPIANERPFLARYLCTIQP